MPRSEVIDLGNGKQLEVADDVAYKHYMSDPQLKATLDKRFKERYGADPSSPAAEPYKRAMILDDIKQITPKSEKIKNLTKDNPVIRVNVNTGGAKGDKPSFTPEDVILQTATGKGDFGREDVDGRVELIDEIGKGYKIRVPGVDHLVNATSIKWDKKHPENGIQIDGSYEGYDKQTHFLERPMDIPLENLPEFVKQAARVNTSGRNYIKSEKKVDSYQKDVEDAKKKSGNDNFMSRWMQLFFKQKP